MINAFFLEKAAEKALAVLNSAQLTTDEIVKLSSAIAAVEVVRDNLTLEATHDVA